MFVHFYGDILEAEERHADRVERLACLNDPVDTGEGEFFCAGGGERIHVGENSFVASGEICVQGIKVHARGHGVHYIAGNEDRPLSVVSAGIAEDDPCGVVNNRQVEVLAIGCTIELGLKIREWNSNTNEVSVGELTRELKRFDMFAIVYK